MENEKELNDKNSESSKPDGASPTVGQTNDLESRKAEKTYVPFRDPAESGVFDAIAGFATCLVPIIIVVWVMFEEVFDTVLPRLLQDMFSGYLCGFLGAWFIHAMIGTFRKGWLHTRETAAHFLYANSTIGKLLAWFVSIIVITLGLIAYVGPVLGSPSATVVLWTAIGSLMATEFSIPLVEGN